MVLLDLGSDIVTPSWLPLAMAGFLLVVLTLLFLSLRHHLRKINLPGDEADGDPALAEKGTSS
ncbi:MAG: hypothetical protein QM804_01800 [Propionicimonas sp.]